MCEDSCSSQTTKEGSESILLVATFQSLFLSQTECCIDSLPFFDI